MEFLRHAFIEIGVAGTENNSDGTLKLFQLGSYFRTGPYGWQQILIQSEEGRTSARGSVELLIQERKEVIPDLGIAKESADLPPIHATEDPVTKHPRNGPRDVPDKGCGKNKNRFRRSERRHRTVIGVQQHKSCYLIG